jgi:putative ABC transport system permease protein
MAASTSSVPLGDIDYRERFAIPDQAAPASGVRQVARSRRITPDYFRVMGIPLIKGRFFTEQDDWLAPRVAIISDMLARRYFAGAEPLGNRLIIGKRD